MIKIGILGDIGSGKSYVAKNFNCPVFNADHEVAKLYQQKKNIFNKLKKSLPKYIYSFPIEKKEISNAILANKNNLKKIVKIVHTEVRKKMNIFLKKHKNRKIVILDIPLLLENKINKKRIY
jgi:dephospho-CoA kinase